MTENLSLSIEEVSSDKEIKEVADFDVQVFTDFKDFEWNIDYIKKEIQNGWRVYAAKHGKETVAALMMKKDQNKLLTINTPIKIAYQGNGFSHRIKEYYEERADQDGFELVVNYCPIDNFRMIALNESHGYRKTGNNFGSNLGIEEWEKKVIK